MSHLGRRMDRSVHLLHVCINLCLKGETKKNFRPNETKVCFAAILSKGPYKIQSH